MLFLLKKVAKEILKAVTSEQPEPRHTLDDDAAGARRANNKNNVRCVVWRVNEAIVSTLMMRACKNVQLLCPYRNWLDDWK